MDKVLKQRLIGASILIALAVIFVPMLFDGGAIDPVSRELNIELPSAPGDRAPIRRLPLDPDQSRAGSQSDRDTSAEVRGAPIERPRIGSGARPGLASDPDGTEAPSTDEAASVDDPPSTSTAPDPEVEDPPPSTDSESNEPEQNEPEPVDAPDAAEQSAQPEAPPASQASTPASSEASDAIGFEVQVASFGNRENAEALVDQLTRLGHVASIDVVVRGPSELHRVRTGPYLERADAERALDQISQTVAGVRPVVVGSSATTAPNTVTGSGFAVQVGSFASRDNALRLLDQLGNQGYETFIHQDRAGSRTIWRVRVGPLGTRAEAAQRLERLIEDDGIDGLVVSHP